MPCERGEGVYEDVVIQAGYGLVFMIVPIVIVSTMTTIYLTVLKQEKRMSAYGRGSLTLSAADDTQEDRTRESTFRTRMVMYRGLSYSLAWFLTFIFPMITLIHEFGHFQTSYTLRVLLNIFYPLQGFFNFLLFIYPKVIAAYQTDTNTTLWQAFILAITSRTLVPRSQGQ